jgi:hypothetical protein
MVDEPRVVEQYSVYKLDDGSVWELLMKWEYEEVESA